jgi:hypothetical protein
MRDILNATHLEDNYPTQYSTFYDLKEKMIYLYLFHLSYFDFFEVIFLPEENGEVNRFVFRNTEGL